VLEAVREAVESLGNQPAPADAVAEHCGLAADTVTDTLDQLKEIGRVQMMNGGYIPN